VAICIGVDILAIFFFFPESQYFRNSRIESAGTINEKKEEASQTDLSSTPIPKKTYLEELSPWSGICPGIPKNTSIINLFLRPWPLVFYPAGIYSFLTFSIILACILGIGNTAAFVFQYPPYNFSPGIQALGIFLPALIGTTLGAIIGGPLTDVYTQWRTRKNNGVFEPEGRLVALIVPFFVVPAGVLMFLTPFLAGLTGRYGLGVAHVTHWAVPFIGAGMVLFGVGSLPTITMTYGTVSVDEQELTISYGLLLSYRS
jgi:hypothetical protein